MRRGLQVGVSLVLGGLWFVACGRDADRDETLEAEALGNRPAAVVNCPAEKAVVCHKPGTPAEQTLCIARPAVNAHLRHGDSQGACGTAADAGTDVDAGVELDAGVGPDAGVDLDAGTDDGGTAPDAGTAVDAGTGEDAGTPVDAGVIIL